MEEVSNLENRYTFDYCYAKNILEKDDVLFESPFEDTKYTSSEVKYQDLAIFEGSRSVEEFCVSVFGEEEWDKIHRAKFSNYHTFKEENLLLERSDRWSKVSKHNIKVFRSRKLLSIEEMEILFAPKLREYEEQIKQLTSDLQKNNNHYECELLLSQTKETLQKAELDFCKMKDSVRWVVQKTFKVEALKTKVDDLKHEVRNLPVKAEVVHGPYSKRVSSLISEKERERKAVIITKHLLLCLLIFPLVLTSLYFYISSQGQVLESSLFISSLVLMLLIPWVYFKMESNSINYHDVLTLIWKTEKPRFESMFKD